MKKLGLTLVLFPILFIAKADVFYYEDIHYDSLVSCTYGSDMYKHSFQEYLTENKEIFYKVLKDEYPDNSPSEDRVVYIDTTEPSIHFNNK